ncbi:hypothetical protein PC116_g34471, partial [Phytophthora cactorum]
MFGDPAVPSPALLPQLDGAAPPSPIISERTDPASKSKEERNREKKEAKAQEKARKAAEKEELKAKEKQRKEADARLRESRKAEQEELKKALEASKKMAEEEEASRGEQDDSVPSLQKPDRGSRSMSRKSFGFLNRDKVKRDSVEALPENRQNGESAAPGPDKPEEQFKRKKSFS